jgi:cytochrome c oxidase assembly protein subunit 15
MWVANIFYEHGHRLIASGVGLLTIVLAVWLWTVETRRWLQWLGIVALGAVVAQGLLGGLTVLFYLPAPISIAHAALAEVFFCLTVTIALVTSPGWIRTDDSAAACENSAASGLRRLATLTTAFVYVQILLGAAMRHTGAGLAIPDFPLMFGGFLPDHWNGAIALHFSHRAGALMVTGLVLATARMAWLQGRRRELVRPSLLLVTLVAAQVTLGAVTVLTRRDPWMNSLHVVCGALVLATSLIVTLRTWRERFRETSILLEPNTEPPAARLKADTAINTLVRITPDPSRPRLQPDATTSSAYASLPRSRGAHRSGRERA